MKHYIGVDIGGTNIVCAIVNEDGNPRATHKFSTLSEQGFDKVVIRLAEAIQDLISEFPEKVDICGVGVGVPGFVDQERGIAVNSSNLGWRNVPIAEKLSGLLNGLPVTIENDVRAYIYGEAEAGAGRGFKHVLGITVGTGLAAAVVNDGQLFYGSGARAGELGHITMEGIPYSCPCGLTGCLETIASGTGIVRQARQAISEGRESILREPITSADVSRGYDEGDAVCRDVLTYTGQMLGRGLATAVTLYSPDVIVIGGGGAAAGERLLAPLRVEIQKNVITEYWNNLQIRTAERLEDAGVIGSALLAKQRFSSFVRNHT